MPKITDHLAREFKRAIEELGFGPREPHFEPSREAKYGDLCTNIACQISSDLKRNPSEIAREIVDRLGRISYFERLIPESNGFINLFYSPNVYEEHYSRILEEGIEIGRGENKKEWRYMEIVSANPTGLLHIGHARNGIFSDTLARLLEYLGYSVFREYLVNDGGNQIKELMDSIWAKYRARFFDPNANIRDLASDKYNGIEIEECVEYIIQRYKEVWLASEVKITESPLYPEVEKVVLGYFLRAIKEDLKKYQLEIGSWRRERNFVNNLSINDLLKSIEKHLEYRAGAVWFNLSKIDENLKDEVLIKGDGHHTYFCQDLIYHTLKLRLLGENDRIINVLGSDHQGHIIRLRGFLDAINVPHSKIEFITIQMVNLTEDNKSVKMSKRRSNVIHMRDLENFMDYEEVRWFFVSQAANTPLEIDVKKLEAKDYNNPVYYVLYAYSRIHKIFTKLEDPKRFLKEFKFINLSEKERAMWNMLVSYESVLISAAKTLSPHKIPQYLHKLAQLFHSYYEETNILAIEDELQLNEKLALLNAIKTTIYSGLLLLKIKAKNEL